MARKDMLRSAHAAGTMDTWPMWKGRRLMLEVLFDIEAAVYEIHDVLIEPPEEDDEAPEDDT